MENTHAWQARVSQLGSGAYHPSLLLSVNLPVCVIFTGCLIKIETMITYNYISIKMLKIKTQLGASVFVMVYTSALTCSPVGLTPPSPGDVSGA